jgi:hypothetical protein
MSRLKSVFRRMVSLHQRDPVVERNSLVIDQVTAIGR